jgi:hypothetical protein
VAEYPKPKRKLARWLGEANNIGQAMCYWVLPKSGVPLARSTVQAIPREHSVTADFQEELKVLDEALVEKFGDPVSYESPKINEEDKECAYDINGPSEVDMLETPSYEPLEPESSMPEADD